MRERKEEDEQVVEESIATSIDQDNKTRTSQIIFLICYLKKSKGADLIEKRQVDQTFVCTASATADCRHRREGNGEKNAKERDDEMTVVVREVEGLFFVINSTPASFEPQ